ncbi:MAG: AMP-binding protein [Proteobacteria bacterium]|nr:AMP-binding protein [Pseudomonadota bacterium]
MYFPRKYAEETPDKPAYIMAGSGETVTYRQLEERANRLANLFLDIGLKPRDHIALLLENNAEFFVVAWAAQRAGLYYTAISTHLTTDEVAYITDNSDSKVFITSLAMKDTAIELARRDSNVHTRIMMNGTVPGFESYEEVTANCPTTPIPNETEGADMLYSSGTTGRPKGVLPETICTPIGEETMAVQVNKGLYDIGPETVYLSPAPSYHAAPLRFCMMMARLGGTAVIMEKFEAVDFLSLVEKYRVTHSQVVPTMFIRLLKLPEKIRKSFDVSSLKIVIHAAAPCPIPLKEQMIEWFGPIISEYYSGTEAVGFLFIHSSEWLEHKGSVGRVFMNNVHILDENENEVPVGQTGTIYFDNINKFSYFKEPEKTQSAHSRQGWSTFGDVGFLDEEQYLYLTDRKTDMIISGGVNIYPQEAENVLVMHPKVSDVAVFGIPHPEFGEEVKAVVEPIDMADATPEFERELIDFCQTKLAKIKCPRSIDFERQLPRKPTGKLFKRLLKDRYWKDQTLTGISSEN